MKKNCRKKIFLKNLLKKTDFFSLRLLQTTRECPQKCQPIWSSCLASYREHKYKRLVIKIIVNIVMIILLMLKLIIIKIIARRMILIIRKIL